jgi:hypothetical protein
MADGGRLDMGCLRNLDGSACSSIGIANMVPSIALADSGYSQYSKGNLA